VTTGDVVANLQHVLDRLHNACAQAGRAPDSVRLIAVTKQVPLAAVAAAVRAGQRDLGENRLQDALPRQDELAACLGPDAPAVRWHFIGHLQRNKAARAAGRFALIHGLHATELAVRLARKAEELDAVQPVLLQVNITGEPQKDGLAPDAVLDVACAVRSLPHLELRGLMAIAREGAAESELRRTFASVRELRDRTAAACGQPLPELSMGMSDDFAAAIREGATMVRIGTAIFGPRRA
jgi:pyridoxal phosphate enzyme (YggS family)